MISVQRITSSSETSLSDLNALLPQLRQDKSELVGTQEDLDAMTSDRNVIFVVAKDAEKTIGMASVYLACITRFMVAKACAL